MITAAPVTRRSAPDFSIQIADARRHAYAPRNDRHAFGTQAPHLFAKTRGTLGKGDPPVRTHDPMPWQLRIIVFAQHARCQSRAPGKSGAPRNFTVASHLTGGQCPHRGTDLPGRR